MARPKGALNKRTLEHGATIETLARAHTEIALKTLARIAEKGESETAQVAAANSLLDRGYGKPRQAIEHTGKDGGPIETALNGLGISDLRALATLIGTLAPSEASPAGGSQQTHH